MIFNIFFFFIFFAWKKAGKRHFVISYKWFETSMQSYKIWRTYLTKLLHCKMNSGFFVITITFLRVAEKENR